VTGLKKTSARKEPSGDHLFGYWHAKVEVKFILVALKLAVLLEGKATLELFSCL